MAGKNNISSFIFEGIIVFLVIFTPLFYGALLPLPFAIVEIVSLSLFLVLVLHLIFSGQHKIVYHPSMLFLIIFIALVILQCFSLPKGLLMIVSGKTGSLYQQYCPAWADKSTYALSIYPLATRMEIIKLLGYFCVFFVTFNMINKQSQIERLLAVIIIWAACLSLHGVMRRYFDPTPVVRMFGTFGNRNNYAKYMVMIVSICIGYVLAYSNKYKKMLFAFLAVLIAATIFISFSRAGVISLIVALLFLSGWLLLERRFIKKEIVLLMVVGGIFLVTLLFFANLEPLKARFIDRQSDTAERLLLYKDSLDPSQQGISGEFTLSDSGVAGTVQNPVEILAVC